MSSPKIFLQYPYMFCGPLVIAPLQGGSNKELQNFYGNHSYSATKKTFAASRVTPKNVHVLLMLP